MHDRLQPFGFRRSRSIIHEFAFSLGIGGGKSHAGFQRALAFLGAFAIVSTGLGKLLRFCLPSAFLMRISLFLARFEFSILA